MEIIEPARVESRPEVPYVGIRVVTPFRGMLGASDKLFAELYAWVEQSGVETLGHGLVRLHVIDMSGPMDLEVGTGHAPADRLRGGSAQAFYFPAATRRSPTRIMR